MIDTSNMPISISDINFADFAVFVDMYNDTGEKWDICTDENNNHTNNDDALKDYYDAYCSYLVSRKYNIDTIKIYRKNAIIDFYITQNNIDNSLRNILDNYYIANVRDTFNKKLNPPPCFFHQARMKQKNEEEREKREIETDDVAQHYINLRNMYKTAYEEMNNVNNVQNNDNVNDNNIQNDYNDELESNNDKYFDHYEEYYNIYDSDYYSDNEYYSDTYSDDYYDNNDY
jgi:hypothetical protein